MKEVYLVVALLVNQGFFPSLVSAVEQYLDRLEASRPC